MVIYGSQTFLLNNILYNDVVLLSTVALLSECAWLSWMKETRPAGSVMQMTCDQRGLSETSIHNDNDFQTLDGLENH